MSATIRRLATRRLSWGVAVALVLLTAASLLWRGSRKPAALPLEFRTELVNRLRAEDVQQTIDNLADFQDTGWVYGSFPTGPGHLGTYAYAMNMTPRLNRVRKLLEQGRKDPAVVIPVLVRKFDEAAQGFEEAEKAAFKRYPDGHIKTVTEWNRKQIVSMAAPYLLAELKHFPALPLMARVYRRPDKRLPVSRMFIWYAMHTLALEHPREGLSPKAKQALDAYLEATRKEVPPPRKVHVSAWNAALEESDFRVVVGKQDIGLAKQPQIELHQYPGQLLRYDYIVGPPDEIIDRWFRQLAKFVDLAYPQAG